MKIKKKLNEELLKKPERLKNKKPKEKKEESEKKSKGDLKNNFDIQQETNSEKIKKETLLLNIEKFYQKIFLRIKCKKLW